MNGHVIITRRYMLLLIVCSHLNIREVLAIAREQSPALTGPADILVFEYPDVTPLYLQQERQVGVHKLPVECHNNRLTPVQTFSPVHEEERSMLHMRGPAESNRVNGLTFSRN